MQPNLKPVLPMEGYFPPHKIFGNLYFVGLKPASTHVLKTEEGLVMFDSGYLHSLPQVLNNMQAVGLNVEDLRYVFHTHGHIDHMGATRALVAAHPAKTFIGKEDAPYVTGENDLTYAREYHMQCDFFTPDVLLNGGDAVRIGSTEISCVATPGHTPGALSYFFNVSDGTETFRAGLHAGSGMNTLRREYLQKYGLPLSLQTDFIAANEKLKKEHVDIFLGNHMHQNETERKYQALLAGDRYAYVNAAEWSAFCTSVQQKMHAVMQLEKAQADAENPSAT